MIPHFPSPAEAFVEKNIFRQRHREYGRIPDFAEVRPRLPAPVLPEDIGWEKLYWSAWESFWSCLRPPEPGSRLVAAYNRPKADHNIDMGRSALFTSLSGYVPGTFNLIELLDNFYANQHSDGFICREIDSDSGEDIHHPFAPNGTGPNLLAWSEWRHFRLSADTERIAAVFWPLLAYHRWCRANRTWRNGLYWTTSYASGLLNQPRVPGGQHHHSHWAWVDASALAALNCSVLERMAVQLGEEELAAELVSEHERLITVINAEMWNEEQRFYQDISPDGRFSGVKSIAGYWTLLDQQLVPADRLTPFVQHLRDTWSFRTENVVPSMSADSDGYNARNGNGWRGAVWPALTYLVLRGLHATGQYRLAHQLAISHAGLVCHLYEESGHFWENYAPEDPAPGDPAVEDAAGVTPAAVIPTLLESVIGISVDWPLRQVTWRRFLERESAYGVRNLPLGQSGKLDMVGDNETIHIHTDAPFSLTIYNGDEIVRVAIPAGVLDLAL